MYFYYLYPLSYFFNTETEKRVVLQAMHRWEENTCIRFRPKRSGDDYSVLIMTGSYAGKLVHIIISSALYGN